jgi:hypothetical protein
MVLSRLTRENCVFCENWYTLYTEKDKSTLQVNVHDTRKSRELFAYDKALGLILCKEDTPNWYKNEPRRESDQYFSYKWLAKMVFLPNLMYFYTQKQIAGTENDHVTRENLANISLLLGVWVYIVQCRPSKLIQKGIWKESENRSNVSLSFTV